MQAASKSCAQVWLSKSLSWEGSLRKPAKKLNSLQACRVNVNKNTIICCNVGKENGTVTGLFVCFSCLSLQVDSYEGMSRLSWSSSWLQHSADVVYSSAKTEFVSSSSGALFSTNMCRYLKGQISHFTVLITSHQRCSWSVSLTEFRSANSISQLSDMLTL